MGVEGIAPGLQAVAGSRGAVAEAAAEALAVESPPGAKVGRQIRVGQGHAAQPHEGLRLVIIGEVGAEKALEIALDVKLRLRMRSMVGAAVSGIL